jgi:hypothetical protein
MDRYFNRAAVSWAAAVFVGFLFLAPAVAADSANPANPDARVAKPATHHNFVRLGKMSFPGAGGEYLDTASLRKIDGEVLFDTLQINLTYRLQVQPTKTEAHLGAVLEHHLYSCAWQSERLVAQGETYGDASAASMPTHFGGGRGGGEFGAGWHRPFVERACAGLAPESESGADSAEAAFAAFKAAQPPGSALPAVPVIAMPPPKPVEQAWMAGEKPHRFVPVAIFDPRGAVLFLDMGNLVRDGAHASGLSLAVLGPDDQRGASSFGSTVALRSVSYDCAARTLTLQQQASWNRYGVFQGPLGGNGEARAGRLSPILAAEIDAACADHPRPATRAFASIEDAWDFARSQWPPRQQTWKASCLWDATPQAARDAYLAGRRANQARPLPLTPDALKPIIRACGVLGADEGSARWAFGRYALQRSAIDRLGAAHGVTEAALYKAWRELSWRERERLAAMQSVISGDDQRVESQLVWRVSAALGLTTDEDRQEVKDYLDTEAVLEPD